MEYRNKKFFWIEKSACETLFLVTQLLHFLSTQSHLRFRYDAHQNKPTLQ